MKDLMRSERVVKNSLKNFFCETSDLLFMYHEPVDLWTHYYSGLMDDPGEQLKNCIEILLENIFVNLLLHVVIVNLKLYHINKGV